MLETVIFDSSGEEFHPRDCLLGWSGGLLRPVCHAASTPLLRDHRFGQQLRHPQHAVAAEGESRHEPGVAKPAHPHLAQRPTVFAPTEGLLDALADALADQVPLVTRRAPIDRRATRALDVLRHVGSDAELAALG